MNYSGEKYLHIYIIFTSTGSEDEVAEKFENAAIIGSCSVVILITLFFTIMVRKYRSHKKQERIQHYTPPFDLNKPTSFTERAYYDKDFCQGEIVYPEIYENTQNVHYLE